MGYYLNNPHNSTLFEYTILSGRTAWFTGIGKEFTDYAVSVFHFVKNQMTGPHATTKKIYKL